MKRKSLQVMAAAILFHFAGCNFSSKHPSDISPNRVVPSEIQMAYHQMELIGFLHFSINTFTNREWGYGDEDPALFNPTQLNVEQWVTTAKSAGFGELILTAKHHDGFCLWPSSFTEHSIKNSSYKNGQGDLVREFVDVCRKHGIKTGLYLSPWDRNHADYGKPEYIIYYRNQLTELLTQYGEINEIWFDGAMGGDGHYGGANETRKIDNKTYYDWDSTFALVKRLQPGISIFSDAGPDVRWVGNEQGFAGETFWSTINREKLIIGKSDQKYLNTGEPEGSHWIIGQCDVSIRPGWFYHQAEDSLVKSPRQLVDIYYSSVGRNAVLLLNLPPDKRGLIHENDVAALKSFKQIIDETFAVNLAQSAMASANNYRHEHKKFSPENVLDNNPKTYWATDDSVLPAQLTLTLNDEKQFDRIMIREPVHLGQRVIRFQVEIMSDTGWQAIFEGTTIGYKRLIRIDPVTTSEVKLTILEANNTVAISEFGLFLSSVKDRNDY